jgi:drug/metabolite transporter (DMT)-like permease
MESEATVVDRRRVIAAFVALALVAGPIASVASNPFYFGLQWPTPLSSAIASGTAGALLLAWCVAKRRPLPHKREWLVLPVLLVPEFASNVSLAPWLHETRWGVMFLIRLAAPLWLALLCAIQVVRAEVPRATVGASIAGIGAVCLITPVDAFGVPANQVPMAAVHLLLGVATVFTWSFAVPRLANASAIACAGGFLLLEAVLKFGSLRLSPIPFRQSLDWPEAWPALAVQAAVAGCTSCLWFWLLQRMRLAAFSMGSLAMWTATISPGFVLFGFLNWRLDVALVIAVAAVVVGLRAQIVDEQPTALGLGES